VAVPAIRRLLVGDDTSCFRCGDPEHDLFLQRYAGQNQDRLFVGTTYAALDGPRVVGYVTVAVGQVDRDNVPSQARGGLPRYPLPVLRLARLAVDEAFQGRGLGRRLAAYAFAVAVQVRAAAGCVGVVVDALAGRESFYEDLGFVELELTSGQSPIRPQPVAMFLPIIAVEAALQS
jgi:GNAT superfamily N-acetyltransferase